MIDIACPAPLLQVAAARILHDRLGVRPGRCLDRSPHSDIPLAMPYLRGCYESRRSPPMSTTELIDLLAFQRLLRRGALPQR